MIVTAEELAIYMDIQRFTNRQEDVANLVLAGLQSEIETILRRPVSVDEYVETYTVDETYLNGRASFFPMSNNDLTYPMPPYPLTLRNSPVVAIGQIRTRNYPGYGIGWVTQTPGVDYTVRRWGVDLYKVNANDQVEVTYTAGLDGASIPFIKISILRAAARELINQIDDVVGIKDLQTRDIPRKETGFTVDEIEVFQRWKRHQIIS